MRKKSNLHLKCVFDSITDGVKKKFTLQLKLYNEDWSDRYTTYSIEHI